MSKRGPYKIKNRKGKRIVKPDGSVSYRYASYDRRGETMEAFATPVPHVRGPSLASHPLVANRKPSRAEMHGFQSRRKVKADTAL